MKFQQFRYLQKSFNLNSSQKVAWSFVKPGKVSPLKPVPDFILPPPYVNAKSKKFPKLQLPFMKEKIEIKSAQDVANMFPACQLASKILDYAGSLAIPGVTTNHIDAMCHQRITEEGAYPSPLKYKGFPKSICTSVNNICCHGIPDDRPLVSGDIISIDVTVFYKGFHGDTCHTFAVGRVDAAALWLMTITKECLDLALEACGPGVPLSTIGNIISSHAHQHNCTVIDSFCGHGIGSYFHGPPTICHGENSDDRLMKEGMVFTIEPVLSEGQSPNIQILDDGWTVMTTDKSRSAQFEHTVAITADGARILTDRQTADQELV